MPGDIISTAPLRPNPLERVTEGRPVIDTNHAQIHAANGFSVFARIAGLAEDATKDFVLVIPASTYVHFQVASLAGDQSADLDLYKGATTVDGAAAMVPSNRHQISNSASVLDFLNVTSVTDPGELFDGDSIYSADRKATAGKSADDNEWVLLPAGKTLFRVTSRSLTFNGILRLFWYEETAA